jgi:outer membrane biosynthesis protein TonB
MSYQLGADSDRNSELFGESRDEDARPRFRGLVAGLIALLAIGVFAVGMWFAYQQGLRQASVGGEAMNVPLIHADERPTKVKPENPGGMEVPDRDKLIYTQKHPAVEHLLPPPEKPMPRPTAAPQSPAAPSVAPPPPTAAATVQPTQPQQLAAKPSAQTPSAPIGPAKPTAAQEARASTHGTRIQLGSVRGEEAARQEWERIKRANADLLASVSATPTRADLGEKGVFYRIQTAPLTDADRICGELKRRNVGCIIVR